MPNDSSEQTTQVTVKYLCKVGIYKTGEPYLLQKRVLKITAADKKYQKAAEEQFGEVKRGDD